MRAAIAGCRGDAGGPEIAIASVEPDAPIVTVEESRVVPADEAEAVNARARSMAAALE